jgi:hypothetical protein
MAGQAVRYITGAGDHVDALVTNDNLDGTKDLIFLPKEKHHLLASGTWRDAVDKAFTVPHVQKFVEVAEKSKQETADLSKVTQDGLQTSDLVNVHYSGTYTAPTLKTSFSPAVPAEAPAPASSGVTATVIPAPGKAAAAGAGDPSVAVGGAGANEGNAAADQAGAETGKDTGSGPTS